MVANALSTALSGLQVSQSGIDTLANNIVNVNTEGFARKEVELAPLAIAGEARGVTIQNITRIVDEFLIGNIRGQATQVGHAETVSDFYEQIQVIYGQPNSDNSINNFLDGFFSSLSSLAVNPELPSLRLNAVNEGVNLANKISEIAQSLHQLRLDADRDIKTTVSFVNTTLSDIFEFNKALRAVGTGAGSGAERANIEEQRDKSLKALAERLDIFVTTQDDGQVTVSTANGIALLDNNLYALQHTVSPSTLTFSNGNNIPAITVSRLDAEGNQVGTAVELVSSGTNTDITTPLTSGRLKGLLEMRDTTITGLLDQLDNFAFALANEFNAIHNDGAGFPPVNSMTGTTSLTLDTQREFTGSVRIAVLHENGTPAPSPYSDEENFRPLTLELGKIDSGTGAGTVSVSDIINEINEHLGPPSQRVSINGLYDVKLGARVDTITTNGVFTFDFQVDNPEAQDITFEVLAVSVTDGGATGLTSALPPAYTVRAGERTRTSYSNDALVPVDHDITVDFNGGAGGPYTVRTQVRVTDADGNITVADLDYVINDNVNNIRNDRFDIDSFTTVSGTSPTIHTGFASDFATARLVDADGQQILADGVSGNLEIVANSGKRYVLAIDELDSQENGLTSDSSVTATNKGFSDFFGLNNFFTTSSTQAGSALNMSVRSDITATPSLLSMGELVLSNQPTDTTQALYTYELSVGNNAVLNRLAGLATENVSFNAAGGLPVTTISLSGYAADLVGFVGNSNNNAQNILNKERVFEDAFQAKFLASSAVNLDEELANVMIFQQAYGASARIITVTKELFDELIAAGR